MESITLKLPGLGNYFVQEALKVLRTNVQFCGQDVKVIALTSCQENEGKSVSALHLASSLADLDKKVLLIDADMRKSVMAGRNTSARNTAGLSEVLTAQKKLKDCLYAVTGSSLHVLFAGKYPPNPVELLSGEYFQTLLDEARKVYDYIIIDTPPLGPVIDAAVIAPQCDGVILVMDTGHVRRRQAQEVIDQLKRVNCRVLGVIMNNVRKNNKSYYSSRYYGKSAYYGKQD